MEPTSILMFGTFEVLQNENKIGGKLWQSRQARDVLKVLVAKRGSVVPSELIIDILWPEEDIKTAQQRLYVRISQLRKLLKTEASTAAIQSVDGGYLFVIKSIQDNSEASGSCWVDVDAFEYAADEGRRLLEMKCHSAAVEAYEKARNLYRGDYLVEDLYEDWTIGERERLRERYLIVLTELSEAYAQMGLYRRAINECRQILTVDSWREAVYVRMMLYYYYAGEKDKALQAYGQCQQMLSAQLGVLPDPSTTRLAERIREGNLWSQSDAPSYPPPAYEGRMFEVPYSLGDAPFSGRDREYAWLVQQWRSNPKGIIWISGEAGIGKSRLAEAFVRTVEEWGVQVYKLRGSVIQNLPYGVWVDALRNNPELLEPEGLSEDGIVTLKALLNDSGLQTKIDFLSENLQSTGRIRDAIQELLMCNHSKTTYLWVDDAHYLDSASLEIFSTLLGKIGILMTSRSEAALPDHPLQRFLEAAKVKLASIKLKHWQLDDIKQFLTRLGGDGIQDQAQSLHAMTRGNPLFLIATLQYLFEQGLLYVTTAGLWAKSGPIDGVLPPDIEEAIAVRLKSVRPDERRMLDAIAVAGGEIDYDLLRAVLDCDESLLLASADISIGQGLLVEPREFRAAELRIAHALYSEVLYKTLPRARRRIFHRRIGEVMLAAGQVSGHQTGVAARHFHLGGADENAVIYARLAAEYALRLYAPQDALQHYRDALGWLESIEIADKNQTAAHLWLGMAEALRLSGDYRQAIDYYQKAFPWLEGELKPAAAYQIFNLKILQGEPLSSFSQMVADFEESLSQQGDSWALALYYWAMSFVSLLQGDQKGTRSHLVKGWRVARQLTARGEQAPFWLQLRAFSLLMRAHNQWGNYETSIRFAQRLLTLVDPPTTDANALANISVSMGESYYHLGRYQKAEENFRQCHALAIKAGDPRLQGEALNGIGWVCFARGEFVAAEDYANQVLALVDAKADYLRQVHAMFLLGNIEIARGNASEKQVGIENILMLARYQQSDPYVARCLLLLAETHLSKQHLDQAETCAQEAVGIAKKCSLKRELSVALRLLAEVKAHLGDFCTGISLVTEALELAEGLQMPFECGLALRTRASLRTDYRDGNKDAEEALRLFERLGASFEADHTRKFLVSLQQKRG